MDLIERAFHIAPDHGSGTLEAAILIAILAVSLPFAMSLIRRRPNVRHSRRLAERAGMPV
jgi:hypothetical protein